MAGRPREFDRDRALEDIRDAFWRHGYEGISMADLVAATGLASARLYAAFGSKEQIFRAAVELYAQGDGAFADRALAEEPTLREALARMLRDAVDTYTRSGALGCMVVSAATNCTTANTAIEDWLEGQRHARTESITARIRGAAEELPADTDPQLLGDYFATVLNGLSVQARDGVSRERLLSLIDPALSVLPPSNGHL